MRSAAASFGLVLGATLLGGGAQAETDWTKARALTVTMTEYRFAPQHIMLRRGVPYRLHLENAGKELHEFTAKAFIAAAKIRNPEVLVAASHDVVLQPGEAKDLYLVVDTPGHYPLSCADHDFLDMTGDITVE